MGDNGRQLSVLTTNGSNSLFGGISVGDDADNDGHGGTSTTAGGESKSGGNNGVGMPTTRTQIAKLSNG